MRRLLALTLALGLALPLFAAAQGQGIQGLDQWKSDGTNITQRTASKPIKITGLSTGLCLTLDGSNILTTTGCGTGGGSWPFTASTYNGVANQSTTTPFYLKNTQIIASSTFFTLASTTQFTNTGATWLTSL